MLQIVIWIKKIKIEQIVINQVVWCKKANLTKVIIKRWTYFCYVQRVKFDTRARKKVEEIIAQTRKNNKSPNEAFSKDGFDKAKYIQIMNEKRDNMIKSKAEIIEKSYAVLTPKQKEQLKVLIDLQNEKIDKK